MTDGGDRDGDRGDRGGGHGGYGDRPRGDRPPREDRPRREERPHPTQHEEPTEETLAKIPSSAPFSAFVSLEPSVAFDVSNDDIGDHFHDDENGTILVERIRIINHQDTNRVRMLFVDFKNAESLRNALHLDKPFRDKPIRIDVAEARAQPARDAPPRARDGNRRDDRDRGGVRATQFDVDQKEAEWMAQRVQDKVAIEDDAPPSSKVRFEFVSFCVVCVVCACLSCMRDAKTFFWVLPRSCVHIVSSVVSLPLLFTTDLLPLLYTSDLHVDTSGVWTGAAGIEGIGS